MPGKDMKAKKPSLMKRLRAWFGRDSAKKPKRRRLISPEERLSFGLAGEPAKEVEEELDPVIIKKVAVAEGLWGAEFCSPIGADFVKSIAAPLKMQEGQAVLDIGCGLGGAARWLAGTYKVEVKALDSRREFVRCGIFRSKSDPALEAIRFGTFNPDTLELEPFHFNAVFVKESLFTVKEKEPLIKTLKDCMKAGSHFVLCDFTLRKPRLKTPAVRKWCAGEPVEPHPVTAKELLMLLKTSGFKEVSHKNLTAHYLKRLEAGLGRLKNQLGNLTSDGRLDKQKAVFLLAEAALWINRATALKSGDVQLSYIYMRTKKTSTMSDW